MKDFQKALQLAKRIEGLGLKINFIEAGWHISKNNKILIRGGDLNRLQYFVEGMEYGAKEAKKSPVQEGKPGAPLFDEDADELAEEVNRLEKGCVRLEKERNRWKKAYNRLRSRMRRAENKVWVAICPNDYRYATVAVGATRDAASEAIMYYSLSNQDIERIYIEKHDVEPETKREKESKKVKASKGKKKLPKGKKKRKK